MLDQCFASLNLKLNFLLAAIIAATAASDIVVKITGNETVASNGKCGGGQYKRIDITVPFCDYTPRITCCHDEDQSATWYCNHTLQGTKLNQSEPSTRPSTFKEAGFYPTIDADQCYTEKEQSLTIGMILANQTLADSYIQPNRSWSLARGHCSPNADGNTAAERLATFYFINAVPQWQCINNGNWGALEDKLRNYALVNNVDLTIATGAWGVTTLKDSKQVPQEIYLGKYSNGTLVKKLPAPRVMYKIIVNKSAGTGVAIVMMNNPWSENHKAEDFVCQNVCGQVSWVTWDTQNPLKGLTYCCKVAEFCQNMPGILPDLFRSGYGGIDPASLSLLT